jgi:hypothetical protein
MDARVEHGGSIHRGKIVVGSPELHRQQSNNEKSTNPDNPAHGYSPS